MMDYSRLMETVVADEVADYVHNVLNESDFAEVIRSIVRQEIENIDIFEIVHDLIEDDVKYSLGEIVADVIKDAIMD